MAAAQTLNAPSSDRWSLGKKQQKPKPPPRLVLYGEPKIGKTTFASSASDVVFIPTEDGSLGLDVARLPSEGKCESFADVMHALKLVLNEQHSFKWVAIDTLNGVEQLCAEMVCQRDFGGKWNSAKGVEGFNAFGKGEKATAQEMRSFLALLDQVQQRRRVGVMLLTHVGLHKQGNALGADFLKFGGEMGKSTWALITGWADQLGHACRELRAATREGESKAKASAIGNERWIIFEGGPGRDAGTRAGYEMPERILLSWDEYASAAASDPIAPLIEQAREMATRSDGKLREALVKRFGDVPTGEQLRELGKVKLEVMINWMLASTRQEGA